MAELRQDAGLQQTQQGGAGQQCPQQPTQAAPRAGAPQQRQAGDQRSQQAGQQDVQLQKAVHRPRLRRPSGGGRAMLQA